jgi:hypothetical protein
MELQMRATCTGTPVGSGLGLDLPAGFTIDTTAMAQATPNFDNTLLGMGAITDLVRGNIEKLAQQQSDTFKVILRSVPQLLNVNNYHEYILWAWKQKLSIQGVPLYRPAYLSINVLPETIRKSFISNYEQAKSTIQQQSNRSINTLTTGRDTSRLDIQLVAECNSVIQLLSVPSSDDIKIQHTELANWLMRWDKEFGLNAYDYYPEYTEFLRSIGYEV